MKRQDLRAYRETGDDPLWSAVWQVWPAAMMFEQSTPFDVLAGTRRRRGRSQGPQHTPREQ